MTRYLISFDDGAMDRISDEDGAAVGKAAHAVVQGPWTLACFVRRRAGKPAGQCGGHRRYGHRRPVPGDEVIGGFAVVEVPSREEALEWAGRFAVACRCAQEVRVLLPDPNSTRCSATRIADGDVPATSHRSALRLIPCAATHQTPVVTRAPRRTAGPFTVRRGSTARAAAVLSGWRARYSRQAAPEPGPRG